MVGGFQVFNKFAIVIESEASSLLPYKTHHWILSWARTIHFTFLQPISLRFILIYFFHLCLCLQSNLFDKIFQPTFGVHTSTSEVVRMKITLMILDYLTMLYQLQRLCSTEWNMRMFMYVELIKIFKWSWVVIWWHDLNIHLKWLKETNKNLH